MSWHISTLIAALEKHLVPLLLLTLHLRGKQYIAKKIFDFTLFIVLTYNMFTVAKALLTLLLFTVLVSSNARPQSQDFIPNFDEALSTDTAFDGISNNDDFMASSPLTNLFDPDWTSDADPIGDQEDLFADNTTPDDSCRAEDSQSLSAFGRLRRREGYLLGSEGSASCKSPAQGNTEDPFWNQLPMADDMVIPQIKSRRDVCPVEIFAYRDIALCTAAAPRLQQDLGVMTLNIRNAQFCMSSAGPGVLSKPESGELG